MAPVARGGDPDESWDAARSLTPDQVRRDRDFIMRLLLVNGPMTDESIFDYAVNVGYRDALDPSSGLRTRRSELVTDGWVEPARDEGGNVLKSTTRRGRRSQLWQAVSNN